MRKAMRLISNVYSNEHLSLKIIYGKLELISIEMLALIFKLLYLLNLFKTVILKIGIHFYSNHVQYIIAYIYIIQDRRVAQYCTHSVLDEPDASLAIEVPSVCRACPDTHDVLLSIAQEVWEEGTHHLVLRRNERETPQNLQVGEGFHPIWEEF